MTTNAAAKGEDIREVDGIVKKYCFDAVESNAGAFSRAIILAQGIKELKKAFTPDILQAFMELQGSPIGFKTDKKYSAEVVRDCAIEALLRGAYPVGNEFNIIADRAYFTKEFFERKLREYPGFSDFVFLPDIPRVSGEKGAIVHCRGKWRLNGVPMESEEDIPVRVNVGQGTDAILGKAKRKFFSRIYFRISGSSQWISEDDADLAKDAYATVVENGGGTETDKLKSEIKSKKNFSRESGAASSVPDGFPPPADDFAKAKARLSLLYDDHKKEIDDKLFEYCALLSFIDLPENPRDKERDAVIRLAAEMKG